MSIEVMRQALEVLEQINQLSIGENAIALPGEIDAAVDNLRAAMEHYDQTSLELCEKCGWKAIIPSEGCLVCARQKPKPVAWMFDFLADDRDEIIRDWTTQEYAEIEREKGFNVRPLYPGPRQWVGLTEEETQTLYDRYAVYQEYGAEDSGWFDFARAIEAWLREKNT